MVSGDEAPGYARIVPRRDRKQRRDPRRLGLEVAVGLDVVDLEVEEPRPRLSRNCPRCGATGRIDLVDTAEQRAFLSCPECGSQWDTDRTSVRTL